jgi:hypothetical protein
MTMDYYFNLRTLDIVHNSGSNFLDPCLSPIGAALTNSNKPPLPKSVQKLIEFLKKEQQVLNLIPFNLLKRHYSID